MAAFYHQTFISHVSSLPSLLPAIMQHRRTVSDTLLFRRPSFLEELKKDGPSSSHSSRSATPLIALLQPSATGEGGIVGQSIIGQPAGAKVTPQHSPQQQNISPREVNTLHPGFRVMVKLHVAKFVRYAFLFFLFPFPPPPRQLPSSQSQAMNQQHNTMRPQTRFPRQRPSNVPSFQFQPLAGRGVPVFYPQQTAIMADPSWYYNNMMLYQVGTQTLCHTLHLGHFK